MYLPALAKVNGFCVKSGQSTTSTKISLKFCFIPLFNTKLQNNLLII